MNRSISVAFVFVCCGSAYGQPQARATAPYVPAARTVDDTVNQWEQRTRVKVDRDARSLISIDVRELNISQLSIPKERYEDALLWTKDIIVKTYLYAVWARNRALVEITKADIASYRLALYVRDRLKILGDPFGNIDFVSMPGGAAVERDARRLGVTQFGVVVPAGPHDYRIVSDPDKLDCRLKIDVTPGTTQTMRCPVTTK